MNLANKSKELLETELKQPVLTEVLAFNEFYLGEDEH